MARFQSQQSNMGCGCLNYYLTDHSQQTFALNAKMCHCKKKTNMWLLKTFRCPAVQFPLLGPLWADFWKSLCGILLQLTREQSRSHWQPGPEPLRIRKRLGQKGHLSLLLGDKSTFVFPAQLKECHYYQINCVLTNQSSHLSFKCESL